MSKTPLSRRDLLALGGVGLGTAALGLPAFGFKNLGKPKLAKNIIFLVSDGMPMSVPTMVDQYRQLMEGKESYWMWLTGQPYVVNALQSTRSLNSVVTDSSAAASTWGSGRRIWNGQINVYPDGTKLRTLYNILQEQGMKTGLVTTTTMTHATPSGFVIVSDSRDDEAAIALQHLSRGVDVLMGGGNRFFAADKRKDKKDLYQAFRAKGYEVVRDRASMKAATGKKILGIFSESHLPYTIDRKNNSKLATTVPTLAQMTHKAIQTLRGSSNGFILQVEGGRVDHGGHANDLPASFFDQIDFEEAIKVAVDFARNDGETLVIITADHACGGTALNGAGDEYIDSTDGLKSLQKMKSSWSNLLAEIRLDPKPDRTRDLVRAKAGLTLKNDELQAILDAIAGKSPLKAVGFYSSASATFGSILGNHTKVTFTSGNHTSDHVLVSALGPGSERIAGLVDNTSLFDIMLAARGLKHSNPPQMSFAEAYKHYYAKHKAAAEILDDSQASANLGTPPHWE